MSIPLPPLRTRMVHIGFGAFHRAHQLVGLQRLRDRGSDWGCLEVNLHSGEAIAALRRQQLRYHVAELDGDRVNLQNIAVITGAVHGDAQGVEAVLEALCLPDVAIVSLTATEKAYCHQPASGELNLHHPDIVHDLANPLRPHSLPGLLLAAIRLRRERGLPPFSVLCCDNMPDNGHITRNVVLALARQQQPELAAWIAAHVTFPATMVDRIVPAMTADSHAQLCQAAGSDDAVGVVCEPFFQWVIEDNFVSGRPPFEQGGAQLVADVLPWEQMKLRMLNGSHSFLAYLGGLAGYPHISDCMADPLFRRATRALMLEEQAATLTMPGVDLTAYADALLDRYGNLAIRHRTAQIAGDGTQKLPQRWLASVRWLRARDQPFDLLALGIAGWMRYVSGVDEQGQPVTINDPLRETLAATVATSAEGTARVEALLALENVFGTDLAADAVFVARVSDFYQQLLAHGAKHTVHQWVLARG